MKDPVPAWHQIGHLSPCGIVDQWSLMVHLMLEAWAGGS